MAGLSWGDGVAGPIGVNEVIEGDEVAGVTEEDEVWGLFGTNEVAGLNGANELAVLNWDALSKLADVAGSMFLLFNVSVASIQVWHYMWPEIVVLM